MDSPFRDDFSNAFYQNTPTTVCKTENGKSYWYWDHLLHRSDGPAVEYPNGDYQWFCLGVKHRDDGPAVNIEGNRLWYRHGACHREDGPAIERADGICLWYWNDMEVTEDQHRQLRDTKKNFKRHAECLKRIKRENQRETKPSSRFTTGRNVCRFGDAP